MFWSVSVIPYLISSGHDGCCASFDPHKTDYGHSKGSLSMNQRRSLNLLKPQFKDLVHQSNWFSGSKNHDLRSEVSNRAAEVAPNSGLNHQNRFSPSLHPAYLFPYNPWRDVQFDFYLMRTPTDKAESKWNPQKPYKFDPQPIENIAAHWFALYRLVCLYLQQWPFRAQNVIFY